MIHIIGAGWYGCHLINELFVDKYEYICWEKSDGVLNGASSHNQNRLHLGFHYPRNSITRQQSRQGFDRFLEKYEVVTKIVKNNIYANSEDSIIDFKTYSAIFEFEKYDLKIADVKSVGLHHCDGAIEVDERLIEFGKAKEYWRNQKLNIRFGEAMTLINGALYNEVGTKVSKASDTIIDCTWGDLEIPEGYFEEFFLTFVIRCNMNAIGAITIMDGPFFSVYPFETSESNEMTYTLTHVKYGILKNRQLKEDEVQAIYRLVLSDLFKYVPEIASSIEFISYFIAKKLKPMSQSASRATEIKKNGNILTVISGKIDAIFTAENLLRAEMTDDKLN